MKPALKTALLAVAVAGFGAGLAACADERGIDRDMLSADFGRAYHEDFAAQIADPDATYKGPPPPSSGERAALAQTRYATDKVKEPPSLNISSSGGGSGGSGGGGGGGGSSGP
ncbi:MAG TPA: hypothetical protein VIC25_09455 [Caulobacteraceae bacterium]|jgi:uncharacterized membrane protein YgcG